MPVALEQFLKQLADSGVIAPGKLETFVPPKAQPKDAQELARQLVLSKQLTKFQAQEILLGRAKSLILGSYTILDKIGAGGMGQVFKAQHRRMERVVAIKMLPAAITTDAAAVARFQREAKAAARLEHPNIVTAFDADEANGLHFLVMQFVDGSDLSALVKKNGPVPVDKALDYILQAARGLDFAHKHGVIHRDIKPSNLLLNSEGTVKIFDMGLARINAVGDAETQAELTGTGAVLGTIDYMAPEQAASTHHADARADIYSLGCTLHYLLTGHAAYGGETLMAKLVAHREQAIPSLGDGVPEQVQAVFKKMAAKKAEDRYRTVSEVIVALEGCQNAMATAVAGSSVDRESQATKQRSQPAVAVAGDKKGPPRKRRTLLIAAGAAGLLLILLGVIVIIRNQKGEEVGRLELPPGQTAEIRERPPSVGKADPNPKPITNAKVNDPAFQQWMMEVAALPAEKQIEAVAKKLQELNPSFDGKVIGSDWNNAPKIEKGVVTEFGFVTDHVVDISPVRALAGLRYLHCAASDPHSGSKFSDLSPLRGMKLTTVYCDNTEVSDLSPLQGMPLRELDVGWCPSISDLSSLKGMRLTVLRCNATGVSDLTPLKGMPLSELDCGSSEVHDLAPLRGMRLTWLICGGNLVSDLSPLKEMPLNNLWCDNTAVSSLSPLRGMPLTDLDFSATQVVDLSPLAGMPLNHVKCGRTPVSDLSPLQGLRLASFAFTPTNTFKGLDGIRQMKSLGQIGPSGDRLLPAAEFWKKFDAGDFKLWINRPGFKKWLADTSSLKPDDQVKAVTAKLQELNPGFDGAEKHEIENGVVTQYDVSTDHVTDISPVRAFAGLRSLKCYGSSAFGTWVSGTLADISPLNGMRLSELNVGNSRVYDLAPLKGMPLTIFGCGGTGVADLSPLKGMKLTTLYCDSNKVADISPLEGMPLQKLTCDHTKVADLSPLEGMPLTYMSCGETPVSDLSPLKGMPLKLLGFEGTKVTNLSLLRGMPLTRLSFEDTPVSDLSPLNGISLTFISLTPKNITSGIEAIHQMKSLQTIGPRWDEQLPAAEFWKKYDAGEFNK